MPYVEKSNDNKKVREGEQRQPQANQEKRPLPQSLLDVAKQILAYPIDNRTPVETIQFVSDLKRQLSFSQGKCQYKPYNSVSEHIARMYLSNKLGG